MSIVMNSVKHQPSDQGDSINRNQDGIRWKNWPIVRNNYQRNAYEAFKLNDMVKSTLYDCMSHSLGFVSGILNIDRLGQTVDYRTIHKTVNWQQKTDNKIIDYMSAAMNNVTINESICVTTNVDDQNRFNELCAKCNQLPQEWNVVQLNQIYDGYKGYSTTKDLYTSDAPIKITLFRNSLSEICNNRPISIAIDLGETNICATAYKINHEYYKNYSATMTKENWSKFYTELKALQTKIVDDISSCLGAWVTLLCGKIKGDDGKNFEQQIFNQVDQFCNRQSDFTENQRNLLSLMARRIDLLDKHKLKQGSQDIAETKVQYSRIFTFLEKLKDRTVFKGFEYHPCILVIDEILDTMPWEMVIKSQPFTRVHSLHLLFDLYERYKDQIENGYLMMKVTNGFALVNPDDDIKLINMYKRLSEYYDINFPNWKFIGAMVPTLDEVSKELAKSDLFVYSGHGSSLQFFSSTEYERMNHNCLMMLFGCESIAMKARGIICEAECSAYTYFRNGCPGVLGALTIVTDIWIDLITIILLTQWSTSKNIKHPTIENCSDDATRARVKRILNRFDGKRNPNLLELLCYVRNETDIGIQIRSAVIYRGLPPYNTTCGQ